MLKSTLQVQPAQFLLSLIQVNSHRPRPKSDLCQREISPLALCDQKRPPCGVRGERRKRDDGILYQVAGFVNILGAVLQVPKVLLQKSYFCDDICTHSNMPEG